MGNVIAVFGVELPRGERGGLEPLEKICRGPFETFHAPRNNFSREGEAGRVETRKAKNVDWIGA